MAVYHQMGYRSNNLVDLPELSAYSGAIFSPINSSPADAAEEIQVLGEKSEKFEVIVDPQLYFPGTEKGYLKDWPYFPKDFDTADRSSVAWWVDLGARLLDDCKRVGAGTVCSPAFIPKTFDEKYFGAIVQIGSELVRLAEKSGVEVIQTAVVSMPALASVGKPLVVASQITQSPSKRVYLVLADGPEPRRELCEVDEIIGAMTLINNIEQSGMPVLVGFCSSDVLLWKAAGANSCAAGKYFNLRRFTRDRWEEPLDSGGGQLPYWFEESLLAFLRQGDLIRIRKRVPELLARSIQSNPFCTQALRILDEAATEPGKKPKWLGLSWRLFLYWFADVEHRLGTQQANAVEMLQAADQNWRRLDQEKTFMEERDNNGIWIRDWLNALNEFVGSS